MPVATFELDYSQFNVRDVITLFLPLLLSCYIALFSFSLSSGVALGLALGSVTSMLTYRWVIDSLSPHVGYFMMTDYVFVFFLLVSVFSLFTMIIETYERRITLSIKKNIVVLLHIFVTAGLTYLIK